MLKMNTNDYFKKALAYKIKFLNIKQKTIADALNIQTTQISGYLKDKRGFSEERKEMISEYLGLSYFEMLELGKAICEDKYLEKKEAREPDVYFKKALSLYMKEKKITQAVLAERIGFARTQLSDYFNDRRGFSEDRKEQIAVYFGTTYVDMLNYGRSLSEKNLKPEKKELQKVEPQNIKEIPDYLIDEFKNIITHLNNVIQQKDEELERFKYLVNALSDENDSKKKNIVSLKEEIETFREDVDDYRGIIKDYREGLREERVELEKVLKENTELKLQLQELRKKEAS